MTRIIILAGYFVMMSYLFVTNKLNQYINPRYQYLIIMTLVLALILTLVELFKWAKEDSVENDGLHEHENCGHNHGGTSPLGKAMSTVLLILPIIVVLFFPSVSLDASVVTSKGFNFPVSKDSTSFGDIEQQYLKPNTHIFFNDEDYEAMMKKDFEELGDLTEVVLNEDNYLQVMELIYNYPQAFAGKPIKLNGFMYNEPKTGKQFLFRFGVLHCVADSGVYGLLLDSESDLVYPDNQWLSIEGVIDSQYYEPFGQTLPTVKVEKTTKISPPKNEYVYRLF
ncbi:TIGR03943 family protein [Vagococcus coleopterorum]|uniref:TIGR03943 family protein n=2 Tax=Vagococcus coleopterorum TaxID=2714946 RepID=A0A6G8AMP1_9ENTE|nr:TIGR03943 family protein [Vagococcus coleopterorum]